MSLVRPRRRRRIQREFGQVVVLFALLVPVILTIGSVVVSVGNWYVLKRHLQTQVDAAALAGGGVANGCQNPDPAQKLLVQNNQIKPEALKYSGDTARATSPYNQQPEDINDVHVVLNSTRYWDQGDPPDGAGLDWTLGNVCDVKFLDVKATDYRVPNLFRWIPLFPSVKARARVEFHKTPSTNGVRPIGVPEFDPIRVYALFVDEGRVSASDVLSISGRGSIPNGLTHVDPATLPAGDPLKPIASQWNTWQGTVTGVNLNNTSNHSVVILASRDSTVDPNYGNGSLQDVCNQNPIQTHCYGGGGLNDGLSFIHIYSGTGGAPDAPAIRDATLSGGCTNDLSRAYFNLDGIDSTTGNPCTVTLTAHLDFNNGGADPTQPPICAQNFRISGGSGLNYVSGDTWTGTYTFPPAPGGRYLMDITGDVRRTPGPAPCASGATKSIPTLSDVAGAYVADAKADVVEYLTLENVTAGLPTTDGNSYPKTNSASVKVTVGFTPPLRDQPLSSFPVRLRFEKGPSQTQGLDCDGASGAGPNGWNGKMATGCDAYQENHRTPTVNCSPPDLLTPPDCIPSETGNFNANGVWDVFANPTCSPNNWDGVTIPDFRDVRWIPLFILDERSTTVSGKKYYPVRRFGGFYVTAGDGIAQGNKNGPPCPGDIPSRDLRGTRELWGHFYTYLPNPFGATVPGPELCPFDDASLCVPTLVE
jgi:Putative Flp pilus-assembly TadE/G-like